jgi:two-component system, NarL family, response regulator LiaR
LGRLAYKIIMPETLNPHLEPLKIVLVEDDPVMQMGLIQFLSAHSAIEIVGKAADGYAAIAIVSQLQPDLVIMDVGLPQLDGIEATQQLKIKLPNVRVLMLTSHMEENEIIAALSCGADGYCVKGTSLHQLLNAIAVVQEGAVYLDPQIARVVIAQLQPAQRSPIGHGPSQTPKVKLSPRELEILKLLVEGQTNAEIATILHLSLSTVKVHIRNIMSKLAVDDRVQAAVVALRSGLV